MKTRMITSFPTRNSFPKVETSIYNRIFAIAEKHTCIIALPTLYVVAILAKKLVISARMIRFLQLGGK